MDRMKPKLHEAAKDAHSRAVGWVQHKLQLISHEGQPSKLSEHEANTEKYKVRSSGQEDSDETGNAAQSRDEQKLRFMGSPIRHLQQSRNTFPVKIAGVLFLGDVHSLSTYVKRDLGFQGQIGSNILLSYGDTMYSDANYSDIWRGMTSNSVALATHDPTKVLDVNVIKVNDVSYPRQFCPLLPAYGEESSTWACGITNAVETTPGQGILYYLLNNRPGGVNHLIGAGIATIKLSDAYPPVPTLTRLPGQQYWWDAACEPWYGDVGAIRGNDGYIYAYGHAKDLPWVYVARVPWQSAVDLESYEYWNGETWRAERLYTTDGLGEKEAVFWQINQGQVIYSPYFSCYLFIYSDNWMNNKVLAKTALEPQGPWSDPITLYQATPVTEGSSIYAAAPHPYYDPRGKSLVVTFTNHPNCIQAIRVTFE